MNTYAVNTHSRQTGPTAVRAASSCRSPVAYSILLAPISGAALLARPQVEPQALLTVQSLVRPNLQCAVARRAGEHIERRRAIHQHLLCTQVHVVPRDVVEQVRTEMRRILQLVYALHARPRGHVEYDGLVEPRDEQGRVDEAIGVGAKWYVQKQPRPELREGHGVEGA